MKIWDKLTHRHGQNFVCISTVCDSGLLGRKSRWLRFQWTSQHASRWEEWITRLINRNGATFQILRKHKFLQLHGPRVWLFWMVQSGARPGALGAELNIWKHFLVWLDCKWCHYHNYSFEAGQFVQGTQLQEGPRSSTECLSKPLFFYRRSVVVQRFSKACVYIRITGKNVRNSFIFDSSAPSVTD